MRGLLRRTRATGVSLRSVFFQTRSLVVSYAISAQASSNILRIPMGLDLFLVSINHLRLLNTSAYPLKAQ